MEHGEECLQNYREATLNYLETLPAAFWNLGHHI